MAPRLIILFVFVKIPISSLLLHIRRSVEVEVVGTSQYIECSGRLDNDDKTEDCHQQ